MDVNAVYQECQYGEELPETEMGEWSPEDTAAWNMEMFYYGKGGKKGGAGFGKGKGKEGKSSVGPKCWTCGQIGHPAFLCPKSDGGGSTTRCQLCNTLGHTAPYCRRQGGQVKGKLEQTSWEILMLAMRIK